MPSHNFIPQKPNHQKTQNRTTNNITTPTKAWWVQIEPSRLFGVLHHQTLSYLCFNNKYVHAEQDRHTKANRKEHMQLGRSNFRSKLF